MEFLQEEKQQSGISFQATLGLPEPAAAKRAEVISVAMSGIKPEIDQSEVKNQLMFNGDDSFYREMLKEQDVYAYEQYREELINEAIQAKNETDYLDSSIIDPVLMSRKVETILEEEYSTKVLNTVETIFGKDFMEAIESSPQGENDYFTAREWAENTMFNNVVADELLAEVDKDDTGNALGDIFDFSINAFLPFYQGADWANSSANPEFEKKFFEFTGNNVQREVERIKAIPDKALRKAELTATLANISSLDNKREFLHAFKYMSDTQANEMTMFTDVLDIVTLGTARPVKGLFKTASSALMRRNPLRAVPEALADESGAVAASLLRQNDPSLSLAEKQAGILLDNYLGIHNNERRLQGAESLTTGAQHAIQQMAQEGLQETIEKLTAATTGAQRMSPIDLKNAVTKTLDELKSDHNGLRILDARTEDIVDYVGPTNSYRVNIHLGRQDGSLFTSQKAAENYAKKYVGIKTNDYEVVQDAASGKWTIKVTRDVDEAKGFYKTLAEKPVEADEMFSTSMAHSIVGRLANASISEGKGIQGSKLKAVHGSQDWWRTFETIAAPYFKLKKNESQELINVLSHVQKRRDVNSGLNPGWFDDALDFELNFNMINGKNPTEAQHMAYWAYRQAMDTEKVLMETSRLSTYIRMGGRRINFKLKGEDGKAVEQGINASVVDNKAAWAEEWLGARKNSRVAIIDEKGNVTSATTGRKSGSVDDKLAEVLADDNYQILWTMEKSGTKLNGRNYNFVIMPKESFTKNNLSFEHTSAGYAGGHHLLHQNPFYVKLGKVGDDGTYDSDMVLVNAHSQKQANQVAETFNKYKNEYLDARSVSEASADAVARRAIEDLPFIRSVEDWADLMSGAKKNVPAVGARQGTSWADNVPNVDDLDLFIPDKRLDRLADYERAFSETRYNPDMMIVKTEANGKYSVDSAPTMNPGDALQAGLQKAITARMQKDAIIRGTQNWAKQFGDKTSWSIQRIQADPIGFLTASPEDVYTAGNWDKRSGGWFNTAETARQSILRQIEQGTATSRMTNWLNDKVHEKLFGQGQKRLPLWEALRTKDPIAFSRSFAYDMFLGLWNIQQFAVQASSTAIIAGIAPRTYPQGIAAAMALKATMYNSNKAISLHFGKHFSKFTGLSADEFAQMAADLRTSGWSHMGGTMAQIADDVTGSVFSGATSKFLEAGRVIPKNMDRFHRHTAWSIAWMEAKKATGRSKFDAYELEQIINRANHLTMSMSSANNAAWQRGVFAPAAQFITYPLRVMEEVGPSLVGRGNLSKAEAARVLGLQTILFGVPSGFTGTLFGPVSPVNFQELWREAAIEMGYEPDKGALKSFTDGLLTTIGAELGADLDFQRLSLGGDGFFKNALEKGFSVEFFAGPGGAALYQTVDAAANAFYNQFLTDNDDTYEIGLADLEFAARQMSSVDTFFRLREVIAKGEWRSKRGDLQTTVTPGEGVAALLLAAKPSELNYSRMLDDMMYNHKKAQSDALKEVNILYKRSFAADNPSEQIAFIKQAKALGKLYKLDPKQLHGQWVRAYKESGASTEEVYKRFQKHNSILKIKEGQ